MFEKLKNRLRNFQPDAADSDTRSQMIGLAILLVLLTLAYSVGRGDGRAAAEAALPQLAVVSAKIDRIEKAMTSNPACSATLLDATRSQP